MTASPQPTDPATEADADPYRPLHVETPEQRRIRELEEQLSHVRDAVRRMRAAHDRYVEALAAQPPPWFVIVIAAAAAYLLMQAWQAMWGAL